MLIEALSHHTQHLSVILTNLKDALDRLDDSGNLSLLQAVMLAAATLELGAEVVLDLGTGGGNSATAFALAGAGLGTKVYTFDLSPAWEHSLKPKLRASQQELVNNLVTPIVGNIANYNFAPLIGSASRVLIFWDAHGYDIAENVLGHLLPLIADRAHFVICHDMADNRVFSSGSYQGKGFWRGVAGANAQDTAYGNIGWVTTVVEQTIPVLDFCYRNKMELHSFDWELHRIAHRSLREEVLPRLGFWENSGLHMAYFSLNETPERHFPYRD